MYTLKIKLQKEGADGIPNINSFIVTNEYIITQTNKGEPVIQNKKAPAGKAYIEIAKRVLGEKIEITIPGREKGFFARLKQIFRKK